MEEDTKYSLPGGGTRSEKAPQYNLTPLSGLRRTALRFGLGAETHGEWNWLRSMQSEELAAAWCKEAYNHMLEHMRKMINGEEPEDDHLGAIGWAHTILCYAEERFGKSWNKLNTAPTVTENRAYGENDIANCQTSSMYSTSGEKHLVHSIHGKDVLIHAAVPKEFERCEFCRHEVAQRGGIFA